MKTTLIILFAFFSIIGVQDAIAQQTIYTCPMHPEVQQSKPGNCAKCGMKLIVKKTSSKTSNPAASPPAKPIQKPATSPATIAPAVVYTCPMHPEVQTSKPGNCPKCGMVLVVQEKPLEQPPKVAEPTPITSPTEPVEQAGHKIEKPGLTSQPKAVRYDLYVKDTIVNFAGKKKHAIAINGTIPGPVLTFTEGDTAEIYVHNLLKKETSIHWHGIFLPNRFDGVPFLTQMPIKPGETYLYKFPVIQNGTYWYHSHSKLQEQIGMYGALILLKRNEPKVDALPVVLSEWTNMKPYQVHRSLHHATDWFAIQKGSTQDYLDAIRHNSFGIKIRNEWKRMLAMDVSDVHYDKFLINGMPESIMSNYKPGDKVKLRIVNAGAATYFWLTYSGGKMTVVGNDGNDVEPVEVDRLIVGVAETYDVIVTIPDNMSYEFVATAEDRTGQASLWLGGGVKQLEEPLPKLKYFPGMKMMNEMMKMNGSMDTTSMKMDMSNQIMDMNTVMYPEVTGPVETRKSNKGDDGNDEMPMQEAIITLNYTMLKAPEVTTLPKGTTKELKFELTGNMNRFLWSIDNKTVTEADKILIKKGENIRIILFNNTMMRHPMHLHGHDFRVINGQGEYAPLKNVLDIMPMEIDTIEFAASESGDWFFHCHILYHMMSGMGRIFSYEDSPPNPDLPDPKSAWRKMRREDNMWNPMVEANFMSNGFTSEMMYTNVHNIITTDWELGLGYKENRHWKVGATYGRFLDKMQFLSIYGGVELEFDKNEGHFNMMEDRPILPKRPYVGVLGIRYVLPLLVTADLRIDNFGRPRFQLSREDIPLTKRLRMGAMFNSDLEYMVGFRYIITKYISVSTHYMSDLSNNPWKRWGGGLTITY